ncbi:MAG: GGDEF domain-containing protein [Eubacteriales bacterium]|jgi:diguanylate cyclase (GGDEF)-like protein
MIDYRAMIYLANTIGIILLGMILIYGRRGRGTLSRADRLFYRSVYMNIILCALDFPVFCFDGLDTAWTRELLYFFNTVQAILLTSMAFTWLLYVAERTWSKEARQSRKMYLLTIPLFFVIIIYIINLFVPVVFTITDDFHYIPDGFMYPVVLIIDLFYFLGSSVYGLVSMRHSKNYQFFPFIFVLIFTIAGGILQVDDFRRSVIYLAAALSFTAVFMEIQNQNSYIDSLSHVYNRQYLSRYVSRVCSESQRSAHMQMTFLMIDVDNFKSINDTYGHQAGDDAIGDIGNMLLEAVPGSAVCARYGGDEFVVILQTVDRKAVQDVIDRFHKLRCELNDSGTRPYKLHISIGSTVLDSEGDTPDAVFRRMDLAMYEQKRMRSSRRNAET